MARWTIPNRAQKWEAALLDYAVCADITNAHDVKPTLAASNKTRNGAAINFRSGSELDQASGIGLFTDNWGNQIWITVAGKSGKFPLMERYGLWGYGKQEPYVFPLQRFFGNGSAERNARMIMIGTGIHQEVGSADWGAFKQYHIDDSRGDEWHTSTLRADYDYTFWYRSAWGILTEIDKLCKRDGKKLNRPVVILLVGDPWTVTDIAKTFLDVLTVVSSTVVPFASKLNIPGLELLGSTSFKQIVNGLAGAAQHIASGKPITVENVGSVLLPTIELVTPQQYHGTIQSGLDVWKAAKRGDYQALAKELGVSVSLAQNIDPFSAMAQTMLSGVSQAKDVIGTIQNAVNLKMVNRVGYYTGTPEGLQSLVGHLFDAEKQITGVTQVQDWFLNAAGGAAAQLVSGAQNVVSLALNEATDTAITDGGSAMWGQLALNAIGFPGDIDAYDPLAYDALRSQVQQAKAQARQFGQKLQSFVLPATVPINKQARYAEYLEEDEGVAVNTSWLSMMGEFY